MKVSLHTQLHRYFLTVKNRLIRNTFPHSSSFENIGGIVLHHRMEFPAFMSTFQTSEVNFNASIWIIFNFIGHSKYLMEIFIAQKNSKVEKSKLI